MSPTPAEVVQAYRHVYKHVLRAVQYSKPARFVARDRVRDGFRKKSAADYDAARITRTLEFLDGAAKIRGLEHRIVKNLMHVWWEQKQLRTTQLYVLDLTHFESRCVSDIPLLGQYRDASFRKLRMMTSTIRFACLKKAWACALDEWW